MTVDGEEIQVSAANPDRRRFTASGGCGSEACSCPGDEKTGVVPVPPTRKGPVSGRFLNQIPPEILHDAALNNMVAALPTNYNFEVHKSVWQLRKAGARRVALQLPEGFHRYALLLRDIMVRFGGCEDALIMANVTYGACCIDDYTAVALGCDYIIHYGHSCLIPVTSTQIPVLYVFVEIAVTHEPVLAALKKFFPQQRVALLATVQYVGVLHSLREALQQPGGDHPVHVFIPQIRPLSPGEVLGCTAPRLPPDTDALLFVADGRFHLEAAMIANPTIPAYRYDPLTKAVFSEGYDHAAMQATRRRMIELAHGAQHFGVILGTLGRQGNASLMESLVGRLKAAGRTVTIVLMTEVRPEGLRLFPHVQAWVQTSCPRLSIDWNYTFGDDLPILTPYELNVMLGHARPFWQPSVADRNPPSVITDPSPPSSPPAAAYPMDFYATGDAAQIAGPWTPGYALRPPRAGKAASPSTAPSS